MQATRQQQREATTVKWRQDQGYESQNESAHSLASRDSRPNSPCDSARPESPAASDVSQLAEDVAGFRAAAGPRPVDMALSQRMETVWHDRFNALFSRFPNDSWFLMPVFDAPDVHNTGVDSSLWRQAKDQAKVRFICHNCQRAWTSMGGQVVFWVLHDAPNNTGYVHFKLYGQKCNECDAVYFEHAIWYQEEVEKVIENLYGYVAAHLYGQPAYKKRMDRRIGHPKREHNTATCQACSDGVCRMGQQQRRKQHQHQHQQQQQQHRRQRLPPPPPLLQTVR